MFVCIAYVVFLTLKHVQLLRNNIVHRICYIKCVDCLNYNVIYRNSHFVKDSKPVYITMLHNNAF